MEEYYIPAGPGEGEYEEKRSRFIGHVKAVETEEEAKEFVAQMKKKYYDARHNCWCYIIRSGATRYSDDSEPQGTAGLPMLEIFKREGIENVVCVVTRYFGGVLLGTGGLLRAYQKAAKAALEDAGTAVMRKWRVLQVTAAYSDYEKVRVLAESDGVLEDTNFGEKVVLSVLVSEENRELLRKKIQDATAGNAAIEEKGEIFKEIKIK